MVDGGGINRIDHSRTWDTVLKKLDYIGHCCPTASGRMRKAVEAPIEAHVSL